MRTPPYPSAPLHCRNINNALTSPANTPSCHAISRSQELQLLALRDKRGQHYEAALAAYSYADRLEQLSRPVGRSADVWLGRAAVAADMGMPAAAVEDLELTLVQLRKNANVGRRKIGGRRRSPRKKNRHCVLEQKVAVRPSG